MAAALSQGQVQKSWAPHGQEFRAQRGAVASPSRPGLWRLPAAEAGLGELEKPGSQQWALTEWLGLAEPLVQRLLGLVGLAGLAGLADLALKDVAQARPTATVLEAVQAPELLPGLVFLTGVEGAAKALGAGRLLAAVFLLWLANLFFFCILKALAFFAFLLLLLAFALFFPSLLLPLLGLLLLLLLLGAAGLDLRESLTGGASQALTGCLLSPPFLETLAAFSPFSERSLLGELQVRDPERRMGGVLLREILCGGVLQMSSCLGGAEDARAGVGIFVPHLCGSSFDRPVKRKEELTIIRADIDAIEPFESP